MQTCQIIQRCSDLGINIFKTYFLSLWLVITSEGLFIRISCELIGESCWEWLVRGAREVEVRGREAYGVR